MNIFKKTASMLIALLMVFSLASTAFAAETTATMSVSVSNSELSVGDEFSVYLNASEDIGSIGAFQMDLYYDQTLFEYQGATTNFTPNHNTNNTTGDRYIRLTTIDFTGSTVIPQGQFCELKFKVLAEGSYTFSLTTVKISDIKGGVIMNVPTAPVSAEVTVASAPQYTGYAVSASEDKTVNVGETAEVQITVSNSEEAVANYNAYDLTLTYDTDKLTYVSAAAADTDASVEEKNGTIRVKGYGADKNVGTAAVTLNFTAKATGDANVVITSAKVDIGNHAIGNDAPDATILDDTTVITVFGYPVTLSESLTGPSVAAPNEAYTFSATDADHYDYTVTATMGGENASVTDNGDGTYTIPNVTGELVINAAMTPKSYSVSVDGTGKDDVNAASTATYNTPYTFTVAEDSGYTYTVSVTIGGKSYTLGNPENGTYTIPGTDVTGDIAITVNKTAKPVTTVSVTKPDYVIGSDTAEKGQDYTFSINEEEGYKYGEPVVTVGGVDITENLVKNEDGSYTIPGVYVTGDIIIEVSRTAAVDVDVTEYITLDSQSIFLVTASGTFAEGSVAKYDGMSMYWSDSYDAYAYLVVSAGGLEAVKAEAAEKVAVAEGDAAGTVDYTGDVNGTTVIDVNDAQLTYDMYNAKYANFETVSMLKFLNADVNADKTVSVADAAAIIAAIK